MSGKVSCLAELRAKKQELLVESELNRVQLLREWSNFKTSMRQAMNPLRAAKWAASSVARAAATFALFRRMFRNNAAPRHPGQAWLNNLISGAKVGASLVSLLRARKRKSV